VAGSKDTESIVSSHPNFLLEWDYVKNNTVDIKGLLPGSHKKVWWVCKKCNYSWKAEIRSRALKGNGCPACSGRVPTESNNLAIKHPYLLDEWDFDKNTILPFEVTPCSGKKVWWVCSNNLCNGSWFTSISHRVYGTGCPYCSGHKVGIKGSVESLFPKLATEWDYEKNNILPKEVTPFSGREVWWKCSVGHSWRAIVKNRTRNSNGCPVCAGQVVTEDNNLNVNKLELVKEWDYTKNDIGPEEVMVYSIKKVWWLCSECGYSWRALVYSRSCGRGCPVCAKGSVSKVSQKWLDMLNIKTREHYIEDLNIRVDGYDPETNTVYEFLGDFWHGNPNTQVSEDVNPVNKKTFRDLHEETLHRLRLLEKSGYKVVYIWERDFNNKELQS